jgi:hypothetical protein
MRLATAIAMHAASKPAMLSASNLLRIICLTF